MLATDRLVLHPYTLDDLPHLATLLGDEETMATMGGPLDSSGARSWLECNLARYERDGYGRYAITLRDTGAFVGDCGLIVTNVEGVEERELGWIVNRAFRGQGIATEAALAWRDRAFGELGLRRFVSIVEEPNVASRRVAQKIGMTVERRVIWGEDDLHGRPYLMYATRSDGEPREGGSRGPAPIA